MKLMVKLFIFRHGETDWNAEQRFQGHLDIPLNDRGRDQARMLGQKLREARLHALMSSDLSRSVETAEIVALEIGMSPSSVFRDPGIREAHLGEAQGLTLSEIRERLGHEVVSRWGSNKATDADVSYPGGETAAEVLERAMKSIQDFAVKNPGCSRLGVSTHGGVIRRLMHRVMMPVSEEKRIPIPNGVVYQLDLDMRNDPKNPVWSISAEADYSIFELNR
jgi:probable phosphoglycerate mutase